MQHGDIEFLEDISNFVDFLDFAGLKKSKWRPRGREPRIWIQDRK
jgi:hypothetical protein